MNHVLGRMEKGNGSVVVLVLVLLRKWIIFPVDLVLGCWLALILKERSVKIHALVLLPAKKHKVS